MDRLKCQFCQLLVRLHAADVGDRTPQSLYSGVATEYVGLDQLNISALPRDLVGAGVINIEIMIDGRVANTTTVSIR